MSRVRLDSAISRRVLVLVERRAVVTATSTELGTILSFLLHLRPMAEPFEGARERGELSPRTVRMQIMATPITLRPADLVQEVLERRRLLEAAVDAERRAGRKVAALEWPRRIPLAIAPDPTALATSLGIGAPAASPAVSRALLLARLIRRLAELWTETEQLRLQRAYLMRQFGSVQALPPRWQATLHEAGKWVPSL